MNAVARIVSCLTCAWWPIVSPAIAQSQTTIEKLVTDGWEIGGYLAASDNRSLILFKHKDHKYLVQCSVLIDVTRAQRLVISCYELK